MALWLDYRTADGRWHYGYGEYQKSLASVAQTTSQYKTVLNALPQWLAKAVDAGVLLADQAKKITPDTALTTWYIWAKDINGTKRMGGEWNFFTGGAEAMKSYFYKVFEPCFKGTQVDATRLMCVITSLTGPATTAGWGKIIGPGVDTSALTAPILVGAALALFLLLR